jgi:predicted DNA-binding transcriptional regulator AlpA
MADPSPFLRPNEVEKISLLSDVTRWRHEKTGNFPRRIRITDRKIVYRKSDIDDWASDPEGWRARNARGVEVA